VEIYAAVRRFVFVEGNSQFAGRVVVEQKRMPADSSTRRPKAPRHLRAPPESAQPENARVFSRPFNESGYTLNA
jgi:hypothetical protein